MIITDDGMWHCGTLWVLRCDRRRSSPSAVLQESLGTPRQYRGQKGCGTYALASSCENRQRSSVTRATKEGGRRTVCNTVPAHTPECHDDHSHCRAPFEACYLDDHCGWQLIQPPESWTSSPCRFSSDCLCRYWVIGRPKVDSLALNVSWT